MTSGILLPALYYLLAICLCMFSTLRVWQYMRERKLLEAIPGPPSSHIIWGNEWHLRSSAPGECYSYWKRLYGDVYKIHGALGSTIICLTDPVAVRFILGQSRFNFPKPEGARAWFNTIVGPGLLYVENRNEHKKLRRLMNSPLSFQAVNENMQVFYRSASRVSTSFSSMLGEQSDGELRLDFSWWTSRYALETICTAGFGWDVDAFGKGNSLASSLDALNNHENTFSAFVMRALIWKFPSILKIPSRKGNSIRETREQLDVVVENILNSSTSMDEGPSLLGVIRRLRVSMNDTVQTSDDYVEAQIRTLISAAFETVSATLTWIFYELAINPSVQDALRDEFRQLKEPALCDLRNRFPLLDAVFKETLRVHSPVLELHHVATATRNVPISKPMPGQSDFQIIIPKGTMVAIPITAFQTDDTLWGCDSKTWQPQRWLTSRNLQRKEAELLAFSYGPRVCAGKAFAEAEIKALVITLLRQYQFTIDQPVESFQSFVVRTRVKNSTHSSLPLIVKRVDSCDTIY